MSSTPGTGFQATSTIARPAILCQHHDRFLLVLVVPLRLPSVRVAAALPEIPNPKSAVDVRLDGQGSWRRHLGRHNVRRVEGPARRKPPVRVGEIRRHAELERVHRPGGHRAIGIADQDPARVLAHQRRQRITAELRRLWDRSRRRRARFGREMSLSGPRVQAAMGAERAKQHRFPRRDAGVDRVAGDAPVGRRGLHHEGDGGVHGSTR